MPADLSVVGYDGSLLTQHISPALTTVRQDLPGLSAAIVHALTEEIAGHPHPRGEMLFDPELVVRSSTAPAPSGTGANVVDHAAAGRPPSVNEPAARV